MDLEPGHPEGFNGQEQSNRVTFRYLVKILTIGSNLGSALASSILFQTQIWPASLAVFFISSAALMLQKLEEVKAWGPITVLFAIVLGIVLYGSAQHATLDFRPCLSIVSALLLYLTVFGLPWIHQALYPEAVENMDSTVGNHTVGNHTVGNHTDGPQGNLPSRPRLSPTPSDEDFHAMDADVQRNQLMRDHLVSNMSHRSQSRLSQRYSDTGTEIDLEPPESTNIALRRVMCLSRGFDIDEFLGVGYPKTPRPGNGASSGSVEFFREAASPNGPEAANEPLPVSASVSANSDSPLL